MLCGLTAEGFFSLKEAVECYVCLNYKFGKLSPDELSMLCLLNFSKAELAISCSFFLHWGQEVV